MRSTSLLRDGDIKRAVDERLNQLVQRATVLGPAAPIAIKAFTGREWDPETGLYYYRARYYDPKAGRFISEDPIGFGGGVNFYGYVGGNPTGFVDPAGLFLTQTHRLITRAAMKAEGFPTAEGVPLSNAVADVDSREGSQDPANAHWHAMREARSPRVGDREAERRYNDYVDQRTAEGDYAAALHAIQDAYSPSHAGFAEWDGGGVRHFPGFGHVWDDKANVSDPAFLHAVEATRRYIREHMKAKQCR